MSRKYLEWDNDRVRRQVVRDRAVKDVKVGVVRGGEEEREAGVKGDGSNSFGVVPGRGAVRYELRVR